MAGDWLKMEHSTPDKAEVLAITAAMGWDDPDLAVGKLFRVWRWFDQQTVNGNAVGVTSALLDRIAGVSGFAKAMQSVGWLVISDGGLTLPNFDRHNGKTAKTRALTANRVRDLRSGEATGNAASVTNSVSREEKRREEKRESKPNRRSRADAAFAEDSVEVMTGKHLFALMRQNNPAVKEPDWQTWAREFDLIFRVDKREPGAVRRVIEWCQMDSFWRTNILSPKALRKQFDRFTLLVHETGGNGVGLPQANQAESIFARMDERTMNVDDIGCLKQWVDSGTWPPPGATWNYSEEVVKSYIAYVKNDLGGDLREAPTLRHFAEVSK